MATLSGGSGITKANLAKRILRRLDDNPYTDIHTNAPTSSGTSLTVASDATKRYQNGGFIDWINDGTFDGALITATAATTLTVRRDHRGATGQAHSANAEFRYLPRYWAPTVSDVIDDAIEHLWPDVFSVSHSTFTIANPPLLWYSLPAATEDLLRVYYKPANQTPQDIELPSSSWKGPEFVDTTLVASGKGLRISTVPAASLTTDNNLHIIYKEKSGLTTFTTAQIELVTLEACIALLATSYAGESKPERRSGLEGAPDPGNAIRYMAGLAADLRTKERERLREYLPERNNKKYTPYKHYTDSAY